MGALIKDIVERGEHPQGISSKVMFVALLASNLLASINQSMLNVALDAITSGFHVDLAMANLVIIGFAIVTGTTIIAAAALLKRWGLRKVMMCGFVVSLVGSVIGLFAWNFAAVLIARILQAIMVGIAFPVITAAIIHIAPKGKIATMLAINSAVIGAGLAFSPTLFGFLITYVSVQACFAVPAVLSFVLLIITPFTMYDIEKRGQQKIDPLSIALSFLGLSAFIYGINIFAKSPITAVPLVIAGVVLIVLFVVRQKRLAEPLLNLEPLKNLQFSLGELLSQLGFMGSLYMSLLMPLFLEGAAKFTPLITGALVIVPILFYAVATYIGGHIEDKYGIWPLMPIGALIMCFGIALTGFAAAHMWIVLVVAGCAITYAGVGMVFSPTKSHDLEAVKPQLMSNASSIHSTMVQVFTSFASALFVGIMSSDVAALMAQGATKADAYAVGFTHTLYIELGISVLVFVGSIFFARAMHKIRMDKLAEASKQDKVPNKGKVTS